MAVFSESVQVKVTLITLWMRVKMEQDTGFWDTRDTTVADVEMKAEQVIARSFTSPTVLQNFDQSNLNLIFLYLVDAVAFSLFWREVRASELA